MRTLLAVLCVGRSLVSGSWRNKLLPVLCKLQGFFYLPPAGDFPLASIVAPHFMFPTIQVKTWLLPCVDLCSSFSLCATLSSLGLYLANSNHLLNSGRCLRNTRNCWKLIGFILLFCSLWIFSRLWWGTFTVLAFCFLLPCPHSFVWPVVQMVENWSTFLGI